MKKGLAILLSCGWLLGCGKVTTSADGNPGDDAASDGASAPDGPEGDDAASTCGDGDLDVGEACDEGTANGTAASCCDTGCAFLGGATTCRAAVSPCDLPENCTGDAAGCPADETAPDESSCIDGPADTCCGGLCVVGAGSCECALPPTPALSVTIIESQSYASWAVMDETWRAQAAALGHTATIVGQATLDSITNLAGTDVLIVPSGIIDLPAARVATIQAFVASGRGAFLQAEYQQTISPNVAFATIVNALGGSFAWTTDLTGDLGPATVTGCTGTYPLTVPAVPQFYYGVTGSGGAGVETLMVGAGGTPLGFSFCRAGGGQLMTTSDGDFVYTINPVEYMTNVITRLAHADVCD